MICLYRLRINQRIKIETEIETGSVVAPERETEAEKETEVEIGIGIEIGMVLRLPLCLDRLEPVETERERERATESPSRRPLPPCHHQHHPRSVPLVRVTNAKPLSLHLLLKHHRPPPFYHPRHPHQAINKTNVNA